MPGDIGSEFNWLKSCAAPKLGRQHQGRSDERFLEELSGAGCAPAEPLEITGILQTVDAKIAVHEAKQRSLQNLFKTLLYQLMTAQIRVGQLDIDTSEMEFTA